MKKISFVILIFVMLFAFLGCTAAGRANLQSYGETHIIKMYNGGILVEQWESVGKVASMEDSDGWQFMDAKTRKLVRVGGDVIIEVK